MRTILTSNSLESWFQWSFWYQLIEKNIYETFGEEWVPSFHFFWSKLDLFSFYSLFFQSFIYALHIFSFPFFCFLAFSKISCLEQTKKKDGFFKHINYFKHCVYQFCTICCSAFKARWNCAVTIIFNNLSFLEKHLLETSLPFAMAKTVSFYLPIYQWKEDRCISILEIEESRHGRSCGRGCSQKLCILYFFPQIMCSSRWEFSGYSPLSPLLENTWGDFFC